MNMASKTGYDLSRTWFDFCFLNPDIIKPNHTALYFFIIEHCNRLGWKDKFGLPTTMAMEAVGIRSYNTYKNTLFDLVEWGFVSMIEKSKNQYSSNIIALSNFNKALDKALDKALLKHGTKHSRSTEQSIDSIDKQLTKNNKPLTINIPELIEFTDYARELFQSLNKDFEPFRFSIESKYLAWTENKWKDGNNKPIKNWKTKLRNTLPHLKPMYSTGTQQGKPEWLRSNADRAQENYEQIIKELGLNENDNETDTTQQSTGLE